MTSVKQPFYIWQADFISFLACAFSMSGCLAFRALKQNDPEVTGTFLEWFY